MRQFYFVLMAMFCMFITSCVDDDASPRPDPPVVIEEDIDVDLSKMPYDSLSSYNFFVGDTIANMAPNDGLIAYEPISTLFADYAHKSRFIWMPEGTSATYAEDYNILEFPEGTVILKTFYYDNVQPENNRRLIETRMLYKKDGEWKFADYIWNDNQTEATFSLSGKTTLVEFIDEGGELTSVNYRVPSEAQCLTCHKVAGGIASPIGPKPQNLNAAYVYPDGSSANQLTKLFEVGYLDEERDLSQINTVVDWEDRSLDIELRARSYLDINCAHCHREGGHCEYRPIRLGFNESSEAVALGVCVTPEEYLDGRQRYIVNPRNIYKSAMYYRLNTTAEEARMPLLGRTVIHAEGVELIENWINHLTIDCD